MERAAVDLHLLVLAGRLLEELVRVCGGDDAVLLAVREEGGIGEVLLHPREPGDAVLERVGDANSEGLAVERVLNVPVAYLLHGADAVSQLVGQLHVGVETSGNAIEEARLVGGEPAVADDARQAFVGVLHAIERDGEPAHRMPEQEDGLVGVLGDGAVDDDVGVVENLVEVAEIGALAVGLPVSAVVEAIGADARIMHLLCEVVIAPLVLAEPMDDHDDGAVLWRDLGVVEEPGAIERLDELI